MHEKEKLRKPVKSNTENILKGGMTYDIDTKRSGWSNSETSSFVRNHL